MWKKIYKTSTADASESENTNCQSLKTMSNNAIIVMKI